MKLLLDVCRILSLLLLASQAWAGTGLTYHGRILKPDGSSLESSAVQFTLQIRSPGNESCLLYQETQTINMSDSGGAFSLEIGADPTHRVAASIDGGYSLSKVFANMGTLTLPSCAYGSTYTPNTADSRLLYISFNDGTGAQNLTAQKINYVPYAIESMQVNGYKANQLLRVDTGTAPVLTTGDLTVLDDLFNGILTNSTASLKLPTTVGASGQVMQTDGSGNLSWVTPATALGYTPLNKAGDTMTGDLTTQNISMAANKYLRLSANTVAGTTAGQMWYDTGVIKYFDGTTVRSLDIAGSTPALTASDITTALGYTPSPSGMVPLAGGTMTGNLLSPEVDATTVKLTTLVVNSNGGSGAATIKYPNTSANTTLTLPLTAGTSGQFLQTDGSGNLSWAAATGTTLPAIAAGQVWVGNASGAAQAFALSGDVSSVSSTGVVTVVKTTTGESNKLLTLDGFGTTNVYGLGLIGSVSGGMLLKTAGSSANYTLTFPGAAPSANQVLQSDASGNLSWINTPSFSGYANGGNTFGANATMGLNDAFNLGFKTNNTTQMTLLSNGNFGIGTAAPSRKLHVQYTANGTDDGIMIENQGNAGSNLSLKSSGTGGHEYMMISTGSANSTGAGYFGIFDQNAVTYRMVISPTGNVGFGTAAPGYTLDLGSRTDAVRLPSGTTAQQPANAAGLLRYNTTNSNVEFNNGSGWSALISSSAGTAFVNGGNSFSGAATLGTNDNNNLNFEANNTTIMTIKPAGTVGINTNNQSANLAIARSTAPTSITTANTYLHLGADEQNTNSYRLIGFGYKTGETYPAAYMGFQETSISNSSRGDLIFGARSSTSDVAPVELMRLTSAGNLSLPKAATRIVSDFTNSTVANRTLFQTSTTDQNTVVGAIPNNSGSTNPNPGAGFQAFNNANPTNAAIGMLAADQGLVYLASNVSGTGTVLPLAFVINAAEKMRIQTDGSVGIGTSSPNARFQVTRDFGTANGGGATVASFQGNNVGDQNYYLLAAYHGLSWRFLVDGTGNANFAGTVSQSSDLRLKRDVTTIDGALEKLSPIHGVNYYWADPSRSPKKQLGVIAQEVEKSFPEAISEDKNGYKTVNYTGLIGPVIQALKELHNKWFVDSAKIHAELAEQKRAISSLEEQNKLLKSALCEKDSSYSFCQK